MGKALLKNVWISLKSSKIEISCLLVNAKQSEEQLDFWKFKIYRTAVKKNKRNKLRIVAHLKYN